VAAHPGSRCRTRGSRAWCLVFCLSLAPQPVVDVQGRHKGDTAICDNIDRYKIEQKCRAGEDPDDYIVMP